MLPVEFSATPTTGSTPLEVQFTDETPGDFSSWSWDFGDGGTSNEQNPTHIYNRTGPFTVSLTINSLSGSGRRGLSSKQAGYTVSLDCFRYGAYSWQLYGFETPQFSRLRSDVQQN